MTEQKCSTAQLPRGWTLARLGELAWEINPGFPSGRWQRNEGQGPLHFRPMNIDIDGKVDLTDVKYVQKEDYDVLRKGDVLFNNTNSPKLLGKTAYMKNDTSWAYSNHMTRIRFLPGSLEPGFIAHYLHYLFRNGFFMTKCVHHVNQASISSSFLTNDVYVPLPPLAEQSRIVNGIEEHFALLDAGLEALGKVKTQLKRYRQAVVKHAFEGKLTEEWRKTHKYAMKPATKLLQYIKEERKRKMKERYKERMLLGFDDLSKLPDGWTWTNSGSLSWFVTSGSRDWKKYYSDSGSLFIRTQDINANKLNLENVARVTLPERIEGKRSLVEKNDILIIITGANVGKVALVEKDIGEAYVSQSVALMKLVMPETSKFVQLAMIADGFGKTCLDKLVYGMGRPVLSLENVQDVALPLAPLIEEQQIVNEIEHKLSGADGVEKVVDQSLRYSESFRQSILKEAFDGKLVPQDPGDEPADKLLQRIRGEKSKSKGGEYTNRKNKSQSELSTYVK